MHVDAAAFDIAMHNELRSKQPSNYRVIIEYRNYVAFDHNNYVNIIIL